MERLRTILRGWFGAAFFFGAPLIVLLIWPGDRQAWVRWLFFVPWLALYGWACWDRES